MNKLLEFGVVFNHVFKLDGVVGKVQLVEVVFFLFIVFFLVYVKLS